MPIIETITIYRGEGPTISFSMSPKKDITGWVISFTVSESYNNPVKLFQITATITSGPLGKFDVILTPTQTNIVPGTYVYDVWRVLPGFDRILGTGPFEIQADARFP